MTATHRMLLVGASGRVGTMVRRAWDRHPPANMQIAYQTRGAEGDVVWDPLEGPAPLLDFIARTGGVDTMVVLAGVVSSAGSDLSPNVSIARACLEAAVRAGIGRVLLASSSAVYGAWKEGPYVENDDLTPLNDYGLAKVQMEAACASFRDQGIEVCCLRIGNVAGADALLLNAAKGDVVLDQFRSGEFPVRSYIGPQSFARVLESLAMASSSLPDCLNVAAPDPVSMEDLADAAGLTWRARPAPSNAQERITLDCTALSHIHAFGAANASAATMVRDWLAVRE